MKYEAIKQAAILLALDNNGIRRERPLMAFLEDLRLFLDKQNPEMLESHNAWLGSLNDAEIEIFVCGERDERLALPTPAGADALFERLFEEVV